MKRLYTYIMAGVLAVSVLLASAGLPLFAHICQRGCKAQVSIVAADLCCKKNCTTESKTGIGRPACCKDKALFLKKELPGLKSVNTVLPLLPVATVISVEDNAWLTDAGNVIPQNNSPPFPAGRALLNRIHILRT